MSLNKAMVIGNLGADPEVRFTNSGTAVCDLSVATNEKWKDKGGAQKERTEWHKVTVFGKTAENCGKYLKKGRQVYVEGRIQTEQWEDRDGNKRYTTKIIAQNVTFLSSGSGSGGAYQGSDDAGGNGGNFEQSFSDENIPF